MLLLAAAAAAIGGCGGERAGSDVILITVDTLRLDRLGYAGYAAASTPNIDRLASEGTVFTQATTPMPRTTPALASLMTGLWPHHHGSREVGEPRVAGVTLAEVLRHHGYETLAVVANSVAGPAQHLNTGFDRFVTPRQLQRRYGGRLAAGVEVAADRLGLAEATTAQALSMLRDIPDSRSVFLWVLYFDPHLPYWTPSSRPEDAPRRWEANRRERGATFADIDGEASRALADCSRLYDQEVAYTDRAIGQLLEGLQALDRFEGAVVVFTADHGENLGEGGLFFEHGDNVHDAALRVPLVFRGPGIAVGHSDAAPVSLIDVAPTLLATLGLAADDLTSLDGVDQSNRLEPGAAAASGGVAFAESASALWDVAVAHVTSGTPETRTCLNGARYSLCSSAADASGVFGLYDHDRDPRLLHNVAAEHPGEVARMRDLWTVWPPGSARYLVARSPTHKLVLSPRLEGGYTRALYDLLSDPTETVDVAGQYPEIVSDLLARLDHWRFGMQPARTSMLDRGIDRTLRGLGYVR